MGLLASKGPNARRDEVARKLVPFLKDSNQLTRNQAANALTTWATEASLPALREALRDEWWPVRHFAIAALANIRRPECAEAIVADFAVDQAPAKDALLQMGSVAEEAVLKLVQHDDPAIRQQACQILAAIGTRRSVSVLREAKQSSNAALAQEAEQAIKAVVAR